MPGEVMIRQIPENIPEGELTKKPAKIIDRPKNNTKLEIRFLLSGGELSIISP